MSERQSIALIPGSYPERNAELAVHAQMTIGGEYIDYASDGETGARANWIVAQINGYRSNPAFKLVKEGGWTSYEDCPQFDVADGHVLTPEDFQLQYAAYAGASWQTFARVRREQELDHVLMTADTPSAKDLAYFVFGPERGADPALQEVAMAATQREVWKMRTMQIDGEFVGDQIVPLISTPLSGSMALYPQSSLAEDVRTPQLAESLAELVSAAPQNSRFGIHLCVGDLNNMARGQHKNRKVPVELMNEIAVQFPVDQKLDFITDPIAAGIEAPSQYAEDYEALRHLRLGEGTRYIAGMVHASMNERDAYRVQGMVRANLPPDQLVGWGPNCGLGRDTLPVANKIMRLSVTMAASAVRW